MAAEHKHTHKPKHNNAHPCCIISASRRRCDKQRLGMECCCGFLAGHGYAWLPLPHQTSWQEYGNGSKLDQQGTAEFKAWFHYPALPKWGLLIPICDPHPYIPEVCLLSCPLSSPELVPFFLFLLFGGLLWFALTRQR